MNPFPVNICLNCTEHNRFRLLYNNRGCMISKKKAAKKKKVVKSLECEMKQVDQIFDNTIFAYTICLSFDAAAWYTRITYCSSSK